MAVSAYACKHLCALDVQQYKYTHTHTDTDTDIPDRFLQRQKKGCYGIEATVHTHKHLQTDNETETDTDIDDAHT